MPLLPTYASCESPVVYLFCSVRARGCARAFLFAMMKSYIIKPCAPQQMSLSSPTNGLVYRKKKPFKCLNPYKQVLLWDTSVLQLFSFYDVRTYENIRKKPWTKRGNQTLTLRRSHCSHRQVTWSPRGSLYVWKSSFFLFGFAPNNCQQRFISGLFTSNNADHVAEEKSELSQPLFNVAYLC